MGPSRGAAETISMADPVALVNTDIPVVIVEPGSRGRPGPPGRDGDVVGEFNVVISVDDPSGTAPENTIWFKVQ